MSDPSHTETDPTGREGSLPDGGADDQVDASEKPEEETPSSENLDAETLAPSEEEEPEGVAREVAIGSSEEGIAVNNALRALSRAARSFMLYEPRNQAIRDFLEEYREAMQSALSAHGAMALDIRPFEMVREGEVVYLERDRERSLAFRLFRDGVRRITVEPDVAWEELLRLLEILSIRYTGVRQSEDDIVTLLWKAGFKGIGIVAVEGFVPEEERPEGDLAGQVLGKRRRRKRRSSAVTIDAPDDFDQPMPPFEQSGEVKWSKVDDTRRNELVAEAGSQNLPTQCVEVIRRLLEVVTDPLDPTTLDDVAPLISEVRDFLLSEGQLAHLTSLVRVLESRTDLNPEVMTDLLARFVDNRALRRIIGSASKGSETVPPDLIALLDLIPAQHMAHLMDLLVEERGTASRRLTRLLIEHYALTVADPTFIFERMHNENVEVMVDILRAVSRAFPDKVVHEAVKLASHDSLEVQMEVIWVLGRSGQAHKMEQVLLQMLRSSHREVRIRILEFFASFATESVFKPTTDLVKRLSTRGLTPRESEAAGRVLATADPERAKTMLMEWVKPPGLFKRFVEMPGAQALQRTALYGLVDLPGDDIDHVIRWLSERCAQDIYQLCMKTLVQRRKGGASHD